MLSMILSQKMVHKLFFVHRSQAKAACELGYEPAGLTVHPPPPKMIEGGFNFFV